MAFHAQHVRTAQLHLKKNDPVMRKIIREVGPFTLKVQRKHYEMLVRSIVSQQISTAAAKTILARFRESLEPDGFCPDQISKMTVNKLRKVGISQQKAGYVLDLAKKVSSGVVDLRKISRSDDASVIESLTTVKGIGVWTAQMFLIFSLGRMDVLPVGDLGLQKAVQKNWSLDELPKPAEVETVAAPWRPYASIATWYLWRSLEV